MKEKKRKGAGCLHVKAKDRVFASALAVAFLTTKFRASRPISWICIFLTSDDMALPGQIWPFQRESIHKPTIQLPQLPPGVERRFSTLNGEFSVTDALEPWDIAPSNAWRAEHEHLTNDLLNDHNFDQWIQSMQKLLEKLGLWIYVKSPWLAKLDIGDDWEEELEEKDVWATNILLNHIDEATLARYNLPRPITAPQLIERLAKGPEPFRLLDLPRELRDRIYEFALVEAPIDVPDKTALKTLKKSTAKKGEKATDAASRRRCHEGLGAVEFDRPTLMNQPPLLSVSRQIREECDPIHWGQNAWRVHLTVKSVYPLWDPYFCRHSFLAWIKKMGMHRLRHLRDLEVVTDWCRKPDCNCSDEYIRVRFIEGYGLRIEYIDVEVEERLAELDWKFAAADLQVRSNDRKGKAIISYFMDDPDVWSLGADKRYDDEDEGHYEVWSTGAEEKDEEDEEDIEDRFGFDYWYGKEFEASEDEKYANDTGNEDDEEHWADMRRIMDARSYAHYVKDEKYGYWEYWPPVTDEEEEEE